ncbi:MAG: fructose-bisphosphate aldolase class I [Gammaproteobacteria bacterium]|nr:fructose-bisphosphate aldolase class I [Gammaproteobacteria bacterium]|tara:strand:- start:8521 stop:9531 length:1011 start_codon:yes stop_codon:yes gene_type:complete
MNENLLNEIARNMVKDSKGILAMDESFPTIKKRFKSLNIKDSEDNRRDYRTMLVKADDLNQYISGAILFDETIKQKTSDGINFPEYLNKIGIIPGIKVDGGAKPFSCHPEEKITEGLDNLNDRMVEYKKLGAKFAKWRAVIIIKDNLPSNACLNANAHALARYASICQENDIVPIVEPEVLMDGNHTIETSYKVTSLTLQSVFEALETLDVKFNGMILKPNMVISGYECSTKASPDEVANATVECLEKNVPQSVPGIAFLSGGQSDEDATNNLSLINKNSKNSWKLTFSYGRALQQGAMKKWCGEEKNITEAQKIISKRAKLNSLAASGEYSEKLE